MVAKLERVASHPAETIHALQPSVSAPPVKEFARILQESADSAYPRSAGSPKSVPQTMRPVEVVVSAKGNQDREEAPPSSAAHAAWKQASAASSPRVGVKQAEEEIDRAPEKTTQRVSGQAQASTVTVPLQTDPASPAPAPEPQRLTSQQVKPEGMPAAAPLVSSSVPEQKQQDMAKLTEPVNAAHDAPSLHRRPSQPQRTKESAPAEHAVATEPSANLAPQEVPVAADATPTPALNHVPQHAVQSIPKAAADPIPTGASLPRAAPVVHPLLKADRLPADEVGSASGVATGQAMQSGPAADASLSASTSATTGQPRATFPHAADASPAPMWAVQTIFQKPEAQSPLKEPIAAGTLAVSASEPVLAALRPDGLEHTTLAATPSSLDVGVLHGTHGWLEIRAELTAAGDVGASLKAPTSLATESLRQEAPALLSFLHGEGIHLSSIAVEIVPPAPEVHRAGVRDESGWSAGNGTAARSDGGAEQGRGGEASAGNQGRTANDTRDLEQVSLEAPDPRPRSISGSTLPAGLAWHGAAGSWLNLLA